MIGFLTLFLGLALGPQPVELEVADGVASVEILVDGRSAGRLESPPWKLTIDLGRFLVPRELAAVAYDEAGEEVGRARQWINFPRPPAETSLLLERRPDGTAVARIAWDSLVAVDPQSIRVTFDGRELAVDDPRRVALPPHDLDQLHFLRAELDFSDNVSSVAELTFGGAYADQVTTELTAVLVALDDDDDELPPPAELAGWFEVDDRPAEVVAVDRGPAEVVLVRDRDALSSLDRMAEQQVRMMRSIGAPMRGRDLRFAMRLGDEQRIRFLWPVIEERRADGRFALFPSSSTYGPSEAGVFSLLTRLGRDRPQREDQRLADAVAVAGMSAASRKRRRAVVLLLGPSPVDRSQIHPANARLYLSHLQVPLEVWSVRRKGSQETGDWGEVEVTPGFGSLENAVRRLSKALDRQRLVWLRGTHLPHRVTLTDRAKGLALVR